jgi:hypothetical protein
VSPVLVLFVTLSVPAFAQNTSDQPDTLNQSGAQPLPTTTFTVTVVGTTPLVDITIPVDEVAAPVQTFTGHDIDNSGALDLSSYLSQRLNGVHVNEVQNNPLQPDVNYRGYTASPLLGTPQGLSVYMDGVRLNQPFGDVVSWDLIPRMAIFSGALMPGSNPVFGLNTLGGALSIQTKDGRNARGTTVQLTYGSDSRGSVEFEHGGRHSTSGVDWYLTGNLFTEDGWRDDSPTDVRQLFGKLGWRRDRGDVAVTLAYADNALNGNGLQEFDFLERDYSSVYTKPDETDNRSVFLNVTTRRTLSDRLSLSGNAYFRDLSSATLNGTSTKNRWIRPCISPRQPSRRRCSPPATSPPPLSVPTPAIRRSPTCVAWPTCSSSMNRRRSAMASSTDRKRINRMAASHCRSRAATLARLAATSSRPEARTIAAPSDSCNRLSSVISTRIAASLAPVPSETASRVGTLTASRSTPAWISRASSTPGACSRPTPCRSRSDGT